jgi:hypothetical protein
MEMPDARKAAVTVGGYNKRSDNRALLSPVPSSHSHRPYIFLEDGSPVGEYSSMKHSIFHSAGEIDFSVSVDPKMLATIPYF